uniref:Uncharacterized protein n=1 Tax=Caudovirales sp. ctu3532 TaxID=2827639 RepID=A0A8S5TI62_9CAUD|nr:MAG TPA: hypothetical protein [Caudovirales sp. ctu3532]
MLDIYTTPCYIWFMQTARHRVKTQKGRTHHDQQRNHF